MEPSEKKRILDYLDLNLGSNRGSVKQDQDSDSGSDSELLLSSQPALFFELHSSKLPPQLALLFRPFTNPFDRSKIQLVKKRRINYANQTRPIQLSVQEARKRLPLLYSQLLDLPKDSNEFTSITTSDRLGNHSIGRDSNREDMQKRLDHILDVAEEEIVQERYRIQLERHQESIPETEMERESENDEGEEEEEEKVRGDGEHGQREPEPTELTREEKEDLEFENMLEFESAVMDLYLKGDPSLPTDFYDEIDFDDRWDTTEPNRSGWSREDEDRYFDQEEES